MHFLYEVVTISEILRIHFPSNQVMRHLLWIPDSRKVRKDSGIYLCSAAPLIFPNCGIRQCIVSQIDINNLALNRAHFLIFKVIPSSLSK